MQLFEKFFFGAFLLVALYLILTRGNQVNTILNSFARSSSLIFSTLQGRGGGGNNLASLSINDGIYV